MSKEDKLLARSLGKSEIEKRLLAFRVRPYAELAALPAYETDRLKSGKYKVYVTTYRDYLSDGVVQIVVQAGFDIRFGFGWRDAEGFRMSKNESISEFQEKALYEFI